MRVKVLGIMVMMALLTMSFSIDNTFNLSAAKNKSQIRGPRPANRILKKANRVKAPYKESSIVNTAYNKSADKIQHLLTKAEKLGFHGNILVARKNKIVYQGSVGYSNPIAGIKASITDEYQLASVSKQLTAICVLQLVDSNLIHLDDDISIYLPELHYEKITIRHLLTHTSGLQNYMWLVENFWPNKWLALNNDVIALMAKHKLPLNFYPGKYFEYCNTNYVLLASIVERVSGKSFNTYLKENIFEPTGMKSFTFLDDEAKNAPLGYQPTRRRFKTIEPYVNDGALGDKGVYATLDDMLKWDVALNNNTLVSASLLKEMFKKARVKSGKTVDYGIGFRIKRLGGNKIVYHHGLWNGFRTSIIKNLDMETTVIILNNTNSSAKHWLAKELEKLMNEPIKLTADSQGLQYVSN